jgi:hypothetical protein
MATPPTFSAGAILTAAQMNLVGLWEVKTQTVGTAVASVEVTGAFSADYDNYFITVAAVDTSVATPTFRLTFGATGTAYYSSMYYDKTDGLSTGITRTNNGAYINLALGNTNDDSNFGFYVYNPFLAKRTATTCQYSATDHNGWSGGALANTTSYTAFTLTMSSGTITGGTIRVYGIRN